MKNLTINPIDEIVEKKHRTIDSFDILLNQLKYLNNSSDILFYGDDTKESIDIKYSSLIKTKKEQITFFNNILIKLEQEIKELNDETQDIEEIRSESTNIKIGIKPILSTIGINLIIFESYASGFIFSKTNVLPGALFNLSSMSILTYQILKENQKEKQYETAKINHVDRRSRLKRSYLTVENKINSLTVDIINIEEEYELELTTNGHTKAKNI